MRRVATLFEGRLHPLGQGPAAKSIPPQSQSLSNSGDTVTLSPGAVCLWILGGAGIRVHSCIDDMAISSGAALVLTGASVQQEI